MRRGSQKEEAAAEAIAQGRVGRLASEFTMRRTASMCLEDGSSAFPGGGGGGGGGGGAGGGGGGGGGRPLGADGEKFARRLKSGAEVYRELDGGYTTDPGGPGSGGSGGSGSSGGGGGFDTVAHELRQLQQEETALTAGRVGSGGLGDGELVAGLSAWLERQYADLDAAKVLTY